MRASWFVSGTLNTAASNMQLWDSVKGRLWVQILVFTVTTCVSLCNFQKATDYPGNASFSCNVAARRMGLAWGCCPTPCRVFPYERNINKAANIYHQKVKTKI